MTRTPFTMDLRPFLPEDWKEQIETAVLDGARHIQGERGSTSLGYDEDKVGLDFHTAVRHELYSRLPWLQGLYEDLVPMLLGTMGYGGRDNDPRLRGATGISLIDGEHAVSANVLDPKSKKPGLEWHRDGADVKLALIMTLEDWNGETGGRLAVFLPDEEGNGSVHFKNYEAGHIAVLEAADIPHAVEPLRADKKRICLMFNYTDKERAGWREKGESDYIYGIKEDVNA